MKSGVNIDCNYIIRMKKVMEYTNLPSPRLRKPTSKILYDIDGSILPIVKVECPV